MTNQAENEHDHAEQHEHISDLAVAALDAFHSTVKENGQCEECCAVAMAVESLAAAMVIHGIVHSEGIEAEQVSSMATFVLNSAIELAKGNIEEAERANGEPRKH